MWLDHFDHIKHETLSVAAADREKKHRLVSLRQLGGGGQTYYECTTRVHPVASDAAQAHQTRREGDLEGGVKIKRKEDGKFEGGFRQ